MADMIILCFLNVTFIRQANSVLLYMPRTLENFDTSTGYDYFSYFIVTHVLSPSFHHINSFFPAVELLSLGCPMFSMMWLYELLTEIASYFLYSSIDSMIVVLKPYDFIWDRIFSAAMFDAYSFIFPSGNSTSYTIKFRTWLSSYDLTTVPSRHSARIFTRPVEKSSSSCSCNSELMIWPYAVCWLRIFHVKSTGY